MKLEFDSVSELQQFLNWVHVYGAPRGSAPVVGPAIAQAAAPDTPYPKIDTGDVAFDTPQGAVIPSGAAPADLAKRADAERSGDKASEQPATRKRRTKAEIAADEKAGQDAAARAVIASQSTPQGEASGTAPAKGADSQAVEGPATPSGTNPFEQVAQAGDGAASDGEGPYAEASGEEVVTPFLHLTRAREFIAKHGMPKYNESFTKAGLDPNVMGYNAEQRAQHMVTLAELDKA